MNWSFSVFLASAVMVATCCCLDEAGAVVLMEEHFDVDAVDATDFGINYFGRFGTYSDPNVETSISVSGGVLRLAHAEPGTGGWTEAEVFTDEFGGFSFDPTTEGITITADVGADSSFGDYNVGMTIGPNIFVFHPGFDGPPAGAFRFQNDPAMDPIGNLEMGFTPSNGVMHQWEIAVNQSGDLAIKITDGNNSANVFDISYAHADLNNSNHDILNGFTVGLYRAGPPGTAPHQGLYDNLIVATGLPSQPGDFDGDGDVDGNDFLVWQQGFPTIYDGNDFLIWQQNFPFPGSGSGSGSTAVPEPAAAMLILVAFGFTGALFARRRR